MSLFINTNVESFDAQRNLGLVGMQFAKAVERLSSGLRINGASDDAAGLAISEKLTSQINGFDQSGRNAQDAISMLQTGDSALNTTHQILQRMRELSVQASNDTYTSSDRQNIQVEINQLVQEVDRISQQTDFNTKKLLDGSAGGATVSGGGQDVAGVTAQGAVALTGGYTLTTVTQATKSAVESGATAGGSTFTQASSITITGGLGSETFSTQAGETLETFYQQVNGSGIGATISTDSSNGKVLITNTDYGRQVTTATVSNVTGDFGTSGLAIGFDTSAAGAQYGTVGAAGTFTSVAGGATNAVVTITGPGGTTATITASGTNSDVLSGSGVAAGLSITLTNPGNVVGGDTISVTQNGALKMQVGANSGQTLNINIDAVNSTTLGLTSLNVLTQTSAESAITSLDSSINLVSNIRSTIGAAQNRLTNVLTNAMSAQENALAANSRIADTNVAQETVEFTRDQILMQAGTSVLAQANQAPAGFLSLLR